jgi:hypothetical protein
VRSRHGSTASEIEEPIEWFREFHRLVDEARERFEAKARARIACAIPSVHRLLVEGCGGLLCDELREADGHSSRRVGLYL